ncbi:MAG TPA: NAD(P)/FAD-dependent oxidoreductase [Candidatus Sulfotelmatobacter sp.]|nr:NAD(P)/FAD-dependent oxidoreductase [Candidatus Sulfotelmatobacter sp.]
MSKSVIIIGAGISGLAVGCYLQMNGYNTQIFEMHDKAGGLCTAWKRKGYTIDGCVQWLWGSSPDNSFYKCWEEVGVIQGKEIINLDQLLQIELLNGKSFSLYTDADRLEEEMKRLAPDDTELIEDFTGAIRHFAGFSMPLDKNPELYSALDYLKMLKFAVTMRSFDKWRITLGELSERFKNLEMRRFWQQVWEPNMSVLNLIMQLASMHNKSSGYPVGGSLPIVHSIEACYVKLGGKVNYRNKVNKILVENNQAVGIQLTNGTEYKTDYVISAADGYETIFEMLDGKYVDDVIHSYYETFPIFASLIYVSLGVNRSFRDTPQIISGIKFELEKPIVIGDSEVKFLMVRIYNYDSTLAPQGNTLLTCTIDASYVYWDSVRKDAKLYNQEKERIAKELIAALDKRFPGLAKQVEMVDVATPMTFYRYTANWKGSYEGWLPTPKTPPTFIMKKTLSGLENFYMVGQWVMPGGGLPSGILSGRWVTQVLCRKDGKKFLTTKP